MTGLAPSAGLGDPALMSPRKGETGERRTMQVELTRRIDGSVVDHTGQHWLIDDSCVYLGKHGGCEHELTGLPYWSLLAYLRVQTGNYDAVTLTDTEGVSVDGQLVQLTQDERNEWDIHDRIAGIVLYRDDDGDYAAELATRTEVDRLLGRRPARSG